MIRIKKLIAALLVAGTVLLVAAGPASAGVLDGKVAIVTGAGHGVG